jgi:hypothetical protein
LPVIGFRCEIKTPPPPPAPFGADSADMAVLDDTLMLLRLPLVTDKDRRRRDFIGGGGFYAEK